MGRYAVQYNVKKARKANNTELNRILLPFCITERKQAHKEAEKELFEALAEDINKHLDNKSVTIIACDTLQASNDIISNYLRFMKNSFFAHGSDKSWKNEQAWEAANKAAKDRGFNWVQYNRGTMHKLIGPHGAPDIKHWDQLNGNNEVIGLAYLNNLSGFKVIVDKLAGKWANKILSEDNQIGPNRDLFNLCIHEVSDLCRGYLLDEAAKIYDWLDKYDTMFYPTEDKDIKSLFNIIKDLGINNNVNVSLTLIDYRKIDLEQKARAQVQKANEHKYLSSNTTHGLFGGPVSFHNIRDRCVDSSSPSSQHHSPSICDSDSRSWGPAQIIQSTKASDSIDHVFNGLKLLQREDPVHYEMLTNMIMAGIKTLKTKANSPNASETENDHDHRNFRT